MEEWWVWHWLPLLQTGSSEMAPMCWTAQQARSSSLQHLSEIPFQIHIVAHGWPGRNYLCPLLMPFAVLRGLKRDRKQWAVCPSSALNMKSWAQDTCTTNALQISQQPSMPSGCCTNLGFEWSLQAACWRVAGDKSCSPLCTTVIPSIKYSISLGNSVGAAHRQLIQKCQPSPLLVSMS